MGDGLAGLAGYPFEVRYSSGALARAAVAADLAAGAYAYFSGLFSGVAPDIALIVADETDWLSRQPYGLAFFNDDADQIRPGILVMPAGRGDFWAAMARDIREAAPDRYAELAAAYPDGQGGVDLQPFCLTTLETLPTIGAESRELGAQMRTEGYSTLEELEEHYPGGDDPMSPLNYVWFQYRWLRLAAETFEVDGEQSLVRFWDCFHARDRVHSGDATTASLAPLLTSEVSHTLGRAISDWR